MQTVYFEDHGQDFLAWDIQDGEVVDCRPFQSSIWCGTTVINTNIQVGDMLEIVLPDGRLGKIKYPVESVETVI